jgi:hypothetical protein
MECRVIPFYPVPQRLAGAAGCRHGPGFVRVTPDSAALHPGYRSGLARPALASLRHMQTV